VNQAKENPRGPLADSPQHTKDRVQQTMLREAALESPPTIRAIRGNIRLHIAATIKLTIQLQRAWHNQEGGEAFRERASPKQVPTTGKGILHQARLHKFPNSHLQQPKPTTHDVNRTDQMAINKQSIQRRQAKQTLQKSISRNSKMKKLVAYQHPNIRFTPPKDNRPTKHIPYLQKININVVTNSSRQTKNKTRNWTRGSNIRRLDSMLLEHRHNNLRKPSTPAT